MGITDRARTDMQSERRTDFSNDLDAHPFIRGQGFEGGSKLCRSKPFKQMQKANSLKKKEKPTNLLMVVAKNVGEERPLYPDSLYEES